MRLFIDTGILEEIKEINSYGILDGVTLNPSLIKKAVDNLKDKGKKVNMESYIKEILKTVSGCPVSLEVIGTSYEEMVKEGKKIFDKFNPVAENVYIKVPVNPSFKKKGGNSFDGIRAIKKLSSERIPINCTLVFTPEQALLASKAGAAFVSPFAGRVDDYIRQMSDIEFNKGDYFPEYGLKKGSQTLDDNGILSGIDLVGQITEIFRYYGLETEVLAASIRNPRQVREAALAGADIATVPYKVIKSLLYHHKTVEGIKNFTDDVVEEYENLLRSN